MMQVGFEKPSNDKEKSEDQQSKSIKVLMGVFFDGTGNNMHNINYYRKFQGSKKKWSDSYPTDYSNVAYEYTAYKHTLDGNPICGFDYVRRVYVTGIGTSNRNIYLETDGASEKATKEINNKYSDNDIKSNKPENVKYQSDSMLGNGFGIFSTGVISKVELGCENIYKDLGLVLDVASEKNKIQRVDLSLDVYGFSRGAAAARCFVNCIKKKHGKASTNKESLVSYWFKEGYGYSKDDMIEVAVKVRFMGIYDTVSSYGGWRGVMNFNDVKELGLDCPSDVVSIEKGVHFCAADEYRAKFSLTTVGSYGGKLKQFIFPGAHSDVGGGYRKSVYETLHVNKVLGYYAGFKGLPDLVRDGWFDYLVCADGSVMVEQYREVVNTYGLIPLFLMLEETRANGLRKIIDEKALKEQEVILREEKDLNKINLRLKKVISGKPLYKLTGGNDTIGKEGKCISPCFKETDEDGRLVRGVRHKYIHLSSHTMLIHNAQKNNIRQIFNG